MKHFLLISAAFLPALTMQARDVFFDFTNTGSLNPAVEEPALKQSVELDGRTFSADGVAVSFAACDGGNTHVRLYHSYDAGVDLRIYDGDEMLVRSLDADLNITKVRFTMSLSGASTGTNDINFITSTGDYDWAAETWLPYEETGVNEVVFVSARQSRVATMTVTLSEQSRIGEIETLTDLPVWYTVSGTRLNGCPNNRGVYIRIADGKAEKIIL